MLILKEICHICGNTAEFHAPDNASLLREARCSFCGASIRNSDVADELIKYIHGTESGLLWQTKQFGSYKILNTCSSGKIHEALKECEGYCGSEYFEGIKSGCYEHGILNVDLCEMPFNDNSLDIVISEDVMEHIADPQKGLQEIYRCLKPGGIHIFTVPIHEGRNTESRIGKREVFHGDPNPSNKDRAALVVTDWGSDIGSILEKLNYQVRVEKKHIFHTLEEITNVDNTYDEYLQKKNRPDCYFKYNSIVIAAYKPLTEDEEFSGERFIPGIKDRKLEMEHMQRYRSICPLVKGKKVIDIACGEGYGTSMLAEYAEYAVGMDIDETTVNHASRKYKKTNLTYGVGNIAKIPIEDHSIDVIVSFETIEHVSQEIQEQFLKESRRVLKEDGLLIISTPNKEVYSDRYHYINKFHIHEFYHDEYLNFLHGSYQYIKLYNQSFEVVSVLSSCEGTEEEVRFWSNGSYCAEGKYFIAIVSNRPIRIPPISSVMLERYGENEEKNQRIILLQEEEKRRNRHIRHLDKIIKENDQRILELQNDSEERGRHIEYLDGEITKKDNRIKELQNETAQRNSQIKHLDQLIEKDNRLIQVLQHDLSRLEDETLELRNHFKEEKEAFLQQTEREKQELIQQIRNKEEHIELLLQQTECEKQELIQQIRNKEGHIELLLESEREFERYKNTRGYRSIIRNRKIVDFFLPPDSKRLFVLRVIKRMFKEPKLMAKVIRPAYIGNYIKYLKSDSIEEITRRYSEIVEVAEGTASTPDIQLETPEKCTQAKNDKEDISSELKTDDYEMLCFPYQEAPLVSIIIPVYNQFDYTYHCLKSILHHSGNVPYEILIADDQSTDLTREMEHIVKNIRVIKTESNRGFLLNCNNAAKYVNGNYILFLNNDTQVQENWLQPLVDTMEAYADAGLVGAKLIYPDGRLQEAGGIVWKDASAWNYGHLKDPDDPSFVYLKEADYVSGAAIMIRRNLWREIGGFDERFIPAYYEDTDLAFEVRRHGYKVYMQPKSKVVHFEGVSNGTDTAGGLKKYQNENNKKFYDKWKDILEKEHFENGKDVFLAKDRGQLKKQILVVDHYVPNYDKDAGGRCTYMYLKLFLKMGLKVTFIGDNFARPEPYTSELNAMGIEVLFGNYYYNNWQTWLKENLHYFDYIYLQRPHISIKYIDITKKYAHGKIFYFAHDLHHVRMYRNYLLTGDAKALEESKRWKKIEMELFAKADVCHVVGSYEQELMQKEFPNKPIRNIPLYIYDDIPNVLEKDFSKRTDLLFVGGFGHTPNIDAVIWFADNVYPKVLHKYPDMIWHIAGNKPPENILKLASKNIVFEGFVSDEKLAELYNKCRMAIVPLRYGAGVKGKVIEAAYYQIPLVTTSIGGEGLDKSIGAFSVEDEADKMAELICGLYKDYASLKKMSEAGRRFIDKYFTSEIAKEVLMSDMGL